MTPSYEEIKRMVSKPVISGTSNELVFNPFPVKCPYCTREFNVEVKLHTAQLKYRYGVMPKITPEGS